MKRSTNPIKNCEWQLKSVKKRWFLFGENSSHPEVKTVPRMAALYVTRLQSQTSAVYLKNMLR